jgi:histidinol-phosphate aminotransferase
MTARYQPPPAVPGALRLHLNEHTGGCSPAVLGALRGVTAHDVATYPDYAALLHECAEHLAVDESQLMLVPGLTEGLFLAAIACCRPSARDGETAEGIVVLPAFELYALQIQAAGGRVVRVPSRAGFEFPAEELIAGVTERTRIIFLANPNNPTGLSIPIGTLRRIAGAVPSSVTIVVDEASEGFGGETFLPELPAYSHVVIGRTFSKSYGLAGLRAACLIGDPRRLEPLRDVMPPFGLTSPTVIGWRAALRDHAYRAAYRAQVQESRALVYEFCERAGLEYWPSAGNFVLIRIGGDIPETLAVLRAHNVLIKDRSKEHGCEGCVRITAGVVAHTRLALAALQRVLEDRGVSAA